VREDVLEELTFKLESEISKAEKSREILVISKGEEELAVTRWQDHVEQLSAIVDASDVETLHQLKDELQNVSYHYFTTKANMKKTIANNTKNAIHARISHAPLPSPPP